MKKKAVLITLVVLLIANLVSCQAVMSSVTTDALRGTPANTSNPNQTVKIGWKAVYEPGPNAHFYVTVNDETEYYAGFYELFEIIDFDDWELPNRDFNASEWGIPESALVIVIAHWTGSGHIFYIYQKSDTELALMHYQFQYREHANADKDKYKEILIIPIQKGSKIQVEKSAVPNPLISDHAAHGIRPVKPMRSDQSAHVIRAVPGTSKVTIACPESVVKSWREKGGSQ